MSGTDYTHALPPLPSVPVVGTDQRFAVRRIYCVGRNYADHAIEMGIDPRKDPPFFFLKPADTLLCAESAQHVPLLPYPPLTKNLHHEVELVLAIGRGGRDIPVDQALQHLYGYAVGLDMTRRDLQFQMREAGKSWEIGKTFEHCAPIGPIHPLSVVGELSAGEIAVTVDGELRQRSDLSKLIWSVPEIIADLSRYFTLQPGDLIYSGTPEGVGPVLPGQLMHATIAGLQPLSVRVTP